MHDHQMVPVTGLYRVVRTDPRARTWRSGHEVRFGGLPMVRGIVRDVRNVNRQRRRYAEEHPEIPYEPVTLVIQLARVNSLTDVTAEFPLEDE